MSKRIRLWSREELILALNLYLKLIFGRMHKGNPKVKELASIINRSESSVALRLGNFAACDPLLRQRGIKGLQGGIRQCQPIWDEFVNDKEELLFESEKILAKYQNKSIEEKYRSLLDDISAIKGMEKEQIIKARVNQNVFRNIILDNYENKCALTGIDVPELLVASHIIPWAKNKNERLNPTNGICLSSLYDKAFDCGLISFSDDLKTIISPTLKNNIDKDYYKNYFVQIENRSLSEPRRYLPDLKFLKWHRENVFRG